MFFQIEHFRQLSADVRSKVGQTEDEFVEYMLGKFPGLVLVVWLAASGRRQVAKLADYFHSDFKLR